MNKATATITIMTAIGIPSAVAMTAVQGAFPGLAGALVALAVLVVTVVPTGILCARIITRNPSGY